MTLSSYRTGSSQSCSVHLCIEKSQFNQISLAPFSSMQRLAPKIWGVGIDLIFHTLLRFQEGLAGHKNSSRAAGWVFWSAVLTTLKGVC